MPLCNGEIEFSDFKLAANDHRNEEEIMSVVFLSKHEANMLQLIRARMDGDAVRRAERVVNEIME